MEVAPTTKQAEAPYTADDRLVIPTLILGEDYFKVIVCNPNQSKGRLGNLLTSKGKEKLAQIRSDLFSTDAIDIPLSAQSLMAGTVINMPLPLAAEAYIRRHGGNYCSFRQGYNELKDKTTQALILNNPPQTNTVSILLRDWSIAPFINIEDGFKEFHDLKTGKLLEDESSGRTLMKATFLRGEPISIGLQLKISKTVLLNGHSDQPLNEWFKNLLVNNLRRR